MHSGSLKLISQIYLPRKMICITNLFVVLYQDIISLTVKCWIGYQQQRPVSRANMLRQLWAAARFRLSAAPVCPSLVLSSAADSLVNPGCSLALARYLRAEHQQHSWAGHDIALDDPDWLASQIAGFIQRQV